MAEQDKQFLAAFRELAEKNFQVKLGPGVVGKTTRVALALCFVWALIVWRLSGTLADIGLIIGGVVVTLFCIWWIKRTHTFAEKNPGAALLEGAQLVQWQKFEAEAKGMLPRPGRTALVIADPADKERRGE